MNADPRAFGELLNYIADHGIEIWFDGAGMHWRADEEYVDAEFLRLLRRFREPLRQAYGPEILPPAESAGGSGGIQARRKDVVFASEVAPIADAAGIDLDRMRQLRRLEREEAIGYDRDRPPRPSDSASHIARHHDSADHASG